MILPAPPGMVALQVLEDEEGSDGALVANDVILLRPLDQVEDPSAIPFEAWVLFDGEPIRADALPHFSGFGWRPAVVGAVPGAGWKVDDGNDSYPVEGWAVRSDGSAVAIVVLDHAIRVVDPDLQEVAFQAPGWRNGG